LRDSTQNSQDYANQRYYNFWYGRFNTPDPISSKAANPKDPTSWNMYAYTGGDPVNRSDPSGTDWIYDFNGGWYQTFDPGGFCAMNEAVCMGPNPSVFAYDIGSATPGNFLAWSSFAPLPPGPINGWTPGSGPDPSCVQDTVLNAGAGVGLDLSKFTDPWVQIVGTPNSSGGTYGETELNLSGDATAMNGLIAQMCSLGFANNGQCPGGAGSTPLVGAAHDGFTGNFRSPSLTNSVQVNTNTATGQIQIDVDPYNPAAYPILGAILHGVLQVLPNKINGTDNTYGCKP
jgi:RHS repeat-associated protein